MTLYKSEETNYNHIKSNNHGIVTQFKAAIDSIFEIYPMPSRMMRELINMFPNLNKDLFPTEQQLINYIKYNKRKNGIKSRLDLGE